MFSFYESEFGKIIFHLFIKYLKKKKNEQTLSVCGILLIDVL